MELDRRTTSFYEGAYGISMDEFVRTSRSEKRGLAEFLKINQDIGYVEVGTSEPMNEQMALDELIKNTDSLEMKEKLNFIRSEVPYEALQLKTLHRSLVTFWPFKKNVETTSITRWVSAVFDEKTSQVFSKIYNGKSGIPIYLSIKPEHYLMIADHDEDWDWCSCHNSSEGDYRLGNLDYAMDNCTAVLFSGNPEHEEYVHYQSSNKLVGINPRTRCLVHISEDGVIINREYSSEIKYDRKTIADNLFNRFIKIEDDCDKETKIVIDDDWDLYGTYNSDFGYNDLGSYAVGRCFADRTTYMNIARNTTNIRGNRDLDWDDCPSDYSVVNRSDHYIPLSDMINENEDFFIVGIDMRDGQLVTFDPTGHDWGYILYGDMDWDSRLSLNHFDPDDASTWFPYVNDEYQHLIPAPEDEDEDEEE